jgi:hypothetical protein
LTVGVKPLFHKTAGNHIRSGDEHLSRACDYDCRLREGELQKASEEYSKALDTFLEDERQYQERFDKHITRGGGRFPEKPYETAPLFRLRLGKQPYKSCLSFSRIKPVDQSIILERKVLVHFLDGQYDQVNYDIEEASYRLAGYETEKGILWARVLAAKRLYEESLTRYSKIMEKPYKRTELEGAAEIEQAALQCIIGHSIKAQSLLADYVWPNSVYLLTGSGVFFMENFEEKAKSNSQEALFPLNPKEPVGFIFFITSRSTEASPIVNIRASADLVNAAIEATRQTGAENDLKADALARNTLYYPMPFLTGIMFSLKATSEQASSFIAKMRDSSVVEYLECFGVFSDPQPFRPISDEEHAYLISSLAEKSLVFGGRTWATGSCERSQSTVLKEEQEHNAAAHNAGYCPRCRRAKSKYESMSV